MAFTLRQPFGTVVTCGCFSCARVNGLDAIDYGLWNCDKSTFTASYAGGNSGLATTTLRCYVPCARPLSIEFDRYATCKDSLRIRTSPDGSEFSYTEIYQSNCGTGLITSSVTLPAGTNWIRLNVSANCDGATCDTLWAFTVSG